jgi:F-type H+-transporting ATPase subunit epsilon
VQPNVVTVLADTALRADEIDESAARRAKETAERILADRGDAKTVEQAQEQLTQAVAQLQALERLRRNLQH